MTTGCLSSTGSSFFIDGSVERVGGMKCVVSISSSAHDVAPPDDIGLKKAGVVTIFVRFFLCAIFGWRQGTEQPLYIVSPGWLKNLSKLNVRFFFF